MKLVNHSKSSWSKDFNNEKDFHGQGFEYTKYFNVVI